MKERKFLKIQENRQGKAGSKSAVSKSSRGVLHAKAVENKSKEFGNRFE
jgi:hypothetical protein